MESRTWHALTVPQSVFLLQYTNDLNSQIATFKELMWLIGGPKDSQQAREDIRKARIATVELCRTAKPVIQASLKW